MGPGRGWGFLTKPFVADIQTLTDGNRTIVDARGCWKLSVLAHTGATVTIHRVLVQHLSQVVGDAPSGVEYDVVAPAANTKGEVLVDWPFYLVHVGGGNCSIALL